MVLPFSEPERAALPLALFLVYSAHANAAIAHDINVSFQGDRRIVCFPGDA